MNQQQGANAAGGELARQTASTSLSGSNATYVEDLYERYLAGEAVPADWQRYFTSLSASRGDTPHGPIVRSLTERAQQHARCPGPERVGPE